MTYSIPTNYIFGNTFILRAGGYLHHANPANPSPWVSVYPESGPGYKHVPVAALAIGDTFKDARNEWMITDISAETVEEIDLCRTDEDKTYSGLVKTSEKGKQTAQYITFARL